jgi:diguanylate cyclase (GGDEF)-like protein
MTMQYVLMIEDNPADSRLVHEMLVESGPCEFILQCADRVGTALAMLHDKIFEVILLDLSLPDGQGLETVKQICSAAPDVPIIVLTGLDDEELALQSIESGAQDYITKGQFTGQAILRAMRYAIQRKRMEVNLHFQANHDLLTNLPNRRLFQDRLEQALERARRNHFDSCEKCSVAMMLMDLDGFKAVNDSLGHQIGDRVLQAVASRLLSSIRKTDTAARLGGDEFAIILEGLDIEDSHFIAEKILGAFAYPFIMDGIPVNLYSSVGISMFPEDGDELETLLFYADKAMYRAKQTGNCYRFHTSPNQGL